MESMSHATELVASLIPNETNPLSLRSGINEASIQLTTIAQLLMDKGVFTELEYWQKLLEVAGFEAEVELERYWNNIPNNPEGEGENG